MQDNFEKIRNQMEMVSMLIVALEKINWANEGYKARLEEMLFEAITSINSYVNSKDAKGKGPRLLDLDQNLSNYDGDF